MEKSTDIVAHDDSIMEEIDAGMPSDSLEIIEDSRNTFKKTPLSCKNAVEFLLSGTLNKKVCKYCLNVTSQLMEVDHIMKITGKRAIYDVSIRDMIGHFYPFRLTEDPDLPNQICNRCIDRTITSYLFTQQCEQSERALQNCFNEIHEKIEKLDPLEPTKKRGRKKLKPNHDVLNLSHLNVQDYAEPIINLINRGSALLSPITLEHNNLECPKCWQVLPNLESLLNHKQKHPDTMWFHCHSCGSSFAKQKSWKIHVANCTGKVILQKPTSFRCNNCGTTSENYVQHLQHTEKHKFKRVLDELIVKRSQSLCTVCLVKEKSMVELDKLVTMHGATPELSGNRTVFDILESTVPNTHLYKYQELMISNPVNTFTVTKKMKKGDKRTMYNFCPPTIITNTYNEIDLTIRFIFAQPEANVRKTKKNEDEEKISVEISNSNLIQDYKDVSNKTFGNNLIQDYKDDSNKTFGNEISPCKTCWIFKKPMCRVCLYLDKESNVNEQNLSEDIAVETKACYDKEYVEITVDNTSWIFDKVEKNDETNEDICMQNCDVAPLTEVVKIQQNDKIEMIEIGQTQGQIISEYHNDHIAEQDDEDVIKIKRESQSEKKEFCRKRKQDVEDKDIKKSKWSCVVCLSANDLNRLSCCCCENVKTCQQTTNIVFGSKNETFHTHPRNHTEEIETSVMSTVDANTLITDFIENKVLECVPKEIINGQKNENDTNVNLKCVEAMDIVFEDETLEMDISPAIQQVFNTGAHEIISGINAQDQIKSISQVLPMQLVFNIGTRLSEEKQNIRRFKRPVRRMTSQQKLTPK